MRKLKGIIINGEYLGNKVAYNGLFRTICSISPIIMLEFIKLVSQYGTLYSPIEIKGFDLPEAYRIVIKFENKKKRGYVDMSFCVQNDKLILDKSDVYVEAINLKREIAEANVIDEISIEEQELPLVEDFEPVIEEATIEEIAEETNEDLFPNEISEEIHSKPVVENEIDETIANIQEDENKSSVEKLVIEVPEYVDDLPDNIPVQVEEIVEEITEEECNTDVVQEDINKEVEHMVCPPTGVEPENVNDEIEEKIAAETTEEDTVQKNETRANIAIDDIPETNVETSTKNKEKEEENLSTSDMEASDINADIALDNAQETIKDLVKSIEQKASSLNSEIMQEMQKEDYSEEVKPEIDNDEPQNLESIFEEVANIIENTEQGNEENTELQSFAPELNNDDIELTPPNMSEVKPEPKTDVEQEVCIEENNTALVDTVTDDLTLTEKNHNDIEEYSDKLSIETNIDEIESNLKETEHTQEDSNILPSIPNEIESSTKELPEVFECEPIVKIEAKDNTETNSNSQATESYKTIKYSQSNSDEDLQSILNNIISQNVTPEVVVKKVIKKKKKTEVTNIKQNKIVNSKSRMKEALNAMNVIASIERNLPKFRFLQNGKRVDAKMIDENSFAVGDKIYRWGEVLYLKE